MADFLDQLDLGTQLRDDQPIDRFQIRFHDLQKGQHAGRIHHGEGAGMLGSGPTPVKKVAAAQLLAAASILKPEQAP
ncbi:MAG: hypothetical protein AMXMBFR26_12500 [Porticoccaceae bacterium]